MVWTFEPRLQRLSLFHGISLFLKLSLFLRLSLFPSSLFSEALSVSERRSNMARCRIFGIEIGRRR